jgi:hypothetical protein
MSSISVPPCHQLIVRIWKSALTACTPFDADRGETWNEEYCMFAQPIGNMSAQRLMDPEKELQVLTPSQLPMYAVVSLAGGSAGQSEGIVSGRIAQSIQFPIGWISTIERSPLPFKIGTGAGCQVDPNKLRKECLKC